MAYQIWTQGARKYGPTHATLEAAVASLGGTLLSGITYKAAGYNYEIKPAVAEVAPAPAAKTATKLYWIGTSYGREHADEIALNGARRYRRGR